MGLSSNVSPHLGGRQTVVLTAKDIKRALEGNQATLTRLIDELTPVIQARVARTLLRWGTLGGGRDIRSDVEDLSQEVFVSLFADQGKTLRQWDVEKGLSLKNFVGLVAQRHTASILRNRKQHPWNEEPVLDMVLERHIENSHHISASATGAIPSGAIDSEEAMTSKELLRFLFRRLEEELSPLGMNLFHLIFVKEMSVEDVCEHMNMTADAVYAWRSRLTRMAKKLVNEFGQPERVALEPASLHA